MTDLNREGPESGSTTLIITANRCAALCTAKIYYNLASRLIGGAMQGVLIFLLHPGREEGVHLRHWLVQILLAPLTLHTVFTIVRLSSNQC